MKIRDFSRNLVESFSEFFGCKVKTHTDFCNGVFCVEGSLVGEWETSPNEIPLYEVRIEVTSDNKPRVFYVDFPFTGEDESLDLSLPEALVYIKENLSTVRSKTIYENL